MPEWIGRIPRIDWVLGAGVLITTCLALWTRRRGGRFRGLVGWSWFWVIFGGILVCLSRGRPWISLTLLGLLMFGALRSYFSLAPVRPRDRYAVLATYLAIPVAFSFGATGWETFQATVPVLLFLLFPVLLSIGPPREGLLESLGRVLLGLLLFVFCAAHLGLLVRLPRPGLLELFGILVLGAELPQRLAGRFGAGAGWFRPAFGIVSGVILAAGLGFWAGPWCGLTEWDAAVAGTLVALAVAMGSLLTAAVMRDLELTATVARVGRGAFLDRIIPAVYAAPVFFHYLSRFA